MRGYTFINDNTLEYDENGELTLKGKIRQEMVQKLASEWNDINHQIECRSWRDEYDYDDEADYHDEMSREFADNMVYQAKKDNPDLTDAQCKDLFDQEIENYYNKQREKDNEIYLRQQVVEELLGELGARMMRPYEHWNEDEAYMEWSESRYDNMGW